VFDAFGERGNAGRKLLRVVVSDLGIAGLE
jgi:hypothetical protein